MEFGFFDENLFPIIYNIIYGGLAFVSIIVALSIDFGKPFFINRIGKYFSFFFSILFAFIIGYRTISVGTDTMMYYVQWAYNIPYESITEIIFYYLMKLVKLVGGSFNMFLLFVATLYYYFLQKSSLNFSRYYNTNDLIFLFLFNSLFFSNSLSYNIIRQGLSMSLLLYSYSLFINKNKKYYLFLLLGFLAHTTAIIPILIFLLINKLGYKISIKYFLILYTLGVVLAFFNLGLLDVAPFITNLLGENSRRATYLSKDKHMLDLYSVGFKPQFVIFNTVFLLFSLYLRRKLTFTYFRDKYEILLKYFVTSSFLFFMAFQLPYSDRWGVFSWVVMPVLILPYFSQVKKYVWYKTPMVLFFIFIYLFFNFYTNSK